MSLVAITFVLVARAPALDAAEDRATEEHPDITDAHEGGAPHTVTVRRLYVGAMMPAEIVGELGLRVPSAEAARLGDGEERSEGSVHLRWSLGPTASGQRELEVVLWDGRAYRRPVPAEDSGTPRVLASLIGNLLSDLENRFVAPDAVGVEVVATVEATPETSEPVDTEPPPEAPVTLTSPPGPERSGGRIDLGLAPVLALGPPRHGDAFSGTRVHVRGGYVWPNGATLNLALGVASRAFAVDYRVVRMRTALGAGYTWVGRQLELNLLGAAFVDPWWLLQREGSAALFVDGEQRQPGPVLGGLVGLHARRWWGREIGSRVLLGAFAELGGGVVLDSPSTVAGLSSGNEALTRLGGVELVLGVELGTVIRARRR